MAVSWCFKEGTPAWSGEPVMKYKVIRESAHRLGQKFCNSKKCLVSYCSTFAAGIIYVLTMVSCSTIPKTSQNPSEMPSQGYRQQKAELEERSGIQLVRLHTSGSGYLIDFRYKVVDATKAKTLFDPKIKPYLLDLVTGAKLSVPDSPKTGPLRNTRAPEDGKTYFIVFGNPGQTVKVGSKVTIVIGDLSLENLIVE